MRSARSLSAAVILAAKTMFDFRQLIPPLVAVILLSSVSCSAAYTEASRELPDMIEAAILRGDAGIRIPPGRYYVRPEDGTHLRLEGVSDFTIYAAGVEMVCSETTRAILIEDCENITIRGLTIDYDPLPYTQGTIVAISGDRKSHTIRIDEGYPPAESAIVFKHLIYTPAGELRYGHYYRMEIEALPGNQLRISGLHPHKDGGEALGDKVIISSETLVGRYDPHAIHLYNSFGSVLEDVTIFASPCFGFFEEHSSRTVFRRCVVDRREGRLHSLNADAFHSKFAEVGPRLENCRAMWMGDDGINICGAYHIVLAAEGANLRVLAKRVMDIQAGDPVELLDADGSRLPPAEVLSILKAGQRTEADAANLEGLDLLPDVVDLLQQVYIIELDRPVEISAGSVVGSLNRMGNGFAIIDSEFGNIRSRGILVKAGNGLISGNTLVNCHLEGIKISPEYLWLESGTSRNLRVEDNCIFYSKGNSLLIDNIGSATLHEAIQIVGNEIRSDSYPLIRIRGLDGGGLFENDLRNAEGYSAPDSAVEIRHSINVQR